MLPLMGEDLTARMQHIVAMGPDAVDMVASLTEPTVTVWAGFIFHIFLEPIFG